MSKRARTSSKSSPSQAKSYPKSAIPYAVSQPNRFWKLNPNLPADQYWKKRYWRRRITGRGSYTMDPKASFGRRWGGYLGSKAGEFLGESAQTLGTALLGKITGMGAYSVRKNIFLTGRLPEVVNPSHGGQVIRFQEYLGDVRTSGTAGAFSSRSYLINAGNPDTFPFLSQIAANYEQYEIEGMLFEFRSTSADALNSVNTALGTVMMATQYDVLDTEFASKTEMLNYEFSTSTKPSASCIHMIECDPRQTSVNNLYVLYNQAVPDMADPRLYNLGRFTVATTGFQGTDVNIGEIHVTYQVKLLKPKLFVSLGENIACYKQNTSGTNFYTNALPLGYQATQVDTISSTFNTDFFLDGNHMYFPATSAKLAYHVDIIWQGGTGVAASQAPTPVGTNCSISGEQEAPTPTNPTGHVSLSFYVLTDGNGLVPNVLFDNVGTSIPTGAQHIYIRVEAIPPSILA